MDYQKLENSLIDVIKEEQAKLGYRKEEIRLYYPLGSLNHFFDTNGNEEEMTELLKGFAAYTKERLGEVRYSNRGERFCFFIPPEGSEYVHIHTPEKEFIKELVALVGKHGCTMEEIRAFFLHTEKKIHREAIAKTYLGLPWWGNVLIIFVGAYIWAKFVAWCVTKVQAVK